MFPESIPEAISASHLRIQETQSAQTHVLAKSRSFVSIRGGRNVVVQYTCEREMHAFLDLACSILFLSSLMSNGQMRRARCRS